MKKSRHKDFMPYAQHMVRKAGGQRAAGVRNTHRLFKYGRAPGTMFNGAKGHTLMVASVLYKRPWAVVKYTGFLCSQFSEISHENA
jgi:hypothetical protein